MEKGKSFESFVKVTRVCVDTMYEWAKVHTEFSEAKKIGTGLSLYYFEEIGDQGMRGEMISFSASTWIYQMKCRFGDYGWRNDQKVEPEKHADIETKNENSKLALLLYNAIKPRITK